MALSKKNDSGRRIKSCKRHLFLLLQPLVLGLISVVLWSEARKHGIHFSHEDDVALTGAVITTLAVAYSITASLVFGSVWEKYQKVVISLLKKDKDTFLCYRDERIPIIVHLLLLSLSLPLLCMIGGLQYDHFFSGALSIFSVSFALSLYWIAVVELQNPSKSLWFAERVPKDWLEADIDIHFNFADDKK